jgi:hypothetical protein
MISCDVHVGQVATGRDDAGDHFSSTTTLIWGDGVDLQGDALCIAQFATGVKKNQKVVAVQVGDKTPVT